MPVGMAANIVATDNQSVLRPNQEPKEYSSRVDSIFQYSDQNRGPDGAGN